MATAQPVTPPSPKLAYLSAAIPSLSQTFVYREIFELERRGYSVALYSVRRYGGGDLSAEAMPLLDRCCYLLPVRASDLLVAHARFLVAAPHRYLSAFCKMVCARGLSPKRRFRTLLHFGEGVVLAKRMQKDGVTHVHSHFASHPTSIARVVYLLTGIPYSFSAHAYDIWHDRLLLREKLREARFVACCSGCGKAELIKQGDPADAQKVRLIYHGIDTRRFKPAAQRPQPDNLILAVGRFESVKGFPLLVLACARLKEMGVPFECCIAGDGDDKALVESLVKQHHLEDLVRLPGSVRQEQILQYYQRAAVFALPCIPAADGRHDGIPNVVVEAMATGLPVVSTTIGGVPEVVDHGQTGFLVAPGDHNQLADQLRAVLEDAPLRQRIGKAAREKILEHFDNRITIEPLINLLHKEARLGETLRPATGLHAETEVLS